MESGDDQRGRKDEARSHLSASPGLREIWWVRHGESVGNAGARTADSANYPLTPHGADQAARFAALLPRAPDLIISSPYVRARQTAVPTSARFSTAPAVEWPVEEMHYLSLERIRDTTQIERRALGRGFWDVSDPDFVEGVGAESFRGFIARADGALQRARAESGAFIVIFAHSLFLRGVLWRALIGTQTIDGEAMKLYREFSRGFDIPNCGHFRQVVAADGTVFTGVIRPLDPAEPRLTAEAIQLAGL